MYSDKEFNLDLIKGMHAIMLSMNDERAYMEWINTIPDNATSDDFEYICEEADLFKEAIHEFMRIFQKYCKDGLFIQTTVGEEYISLLFTGKRKES